MNQSAINFLLALGVGFVCMRFMCILPAGLEQAEAIILSVVSAYLVVTEGYQVMKHGWRK